MIDTTGDPAGEALATARQQAWASALQSNSLPDFVTARLKAAATGKAPWLSTMTPAELLLGKSHGVRPLATVSGTCWFRYSMGEPNWYLADEWGRITIGWQAAIDRLKREAMAVGANAVVDVQMRSTPVDPKSVELAGTTDCTVFGTAIKFDRLPASSDPVVATVSALDFVRLLETGIVVCGLAIGTAHDYLRTPFGMTETRPDGINRARQIHRQLRALGKNAAVSELGSFWEAIRRNAHAQLRSDAQRTGNGVLARTHLGQLTRVAGAPPNYIGRHMVIGTVVQTRLGGRGVQDIATVVDMRDDCSPLKARTDDGEAQFMIERLMGGRHGHRHPERAEVEQ